MTYEVLARPIWNGGQLMAFSALDGVTDYEDGLTARTAIDVRGIDIMLPAPGRVRFPGVANRDNLADVPPSQLRRKGKCAPDVSPYHQVFHDYGWTASLYVDLVYAGDDCPTGRPNKAGKNSA